MRGEAGRRRHYGTTGREREGPRPGDGVRLPYAVPVLEEFGSLRELTGGFLGNIDDGFAASLEN